MPGGHRGVDERRHQSLENLLRFGIVHVDSGGACDQAPRESPPARRWSSCSPCEAELAERFGRRTRAMAPTISNSYPGEESALT